MAVLASGSGTLTDLSANLAIHESPGFQRNSRIRLQDRQKVRDVKIAVHFGAFLARQRARRGAVRELLHSFFVFFRKIDRQQEPGEVGRQCAVMRPHESRPNVCFEVRTQYVRTHHRHFIQRL